MQAWCRGELHPIFWIRVWLAQLFSRQRISFVFGFVIAACDLIAGGISIRNESPAIRLAGLARFDDAWSAIFRHAIDNFFELREEQAFGHARCECFSDLVVRPGGKFLDEDFDFFVEDFYAEMRSKFNQAFRDEISVRLAVQPPR